MSVSGPRLPRSGIRVAVVQNASELVHYSYGDSSEVFRELGCITTSFTDYSIGLFLESLAGHEIDVVVIGPNALNIATTREALLMSPGRDALQSFLLTGGGLLILHQGGLAGSRYQIEALDFLPESLRGIRARMRPNTEPPSRGTVIEWDGHGLRGDRHIVMAAPNQLNSRKIEELGATNAEIPALYWHYWDHVDVAWWHPLLLDVDPAEARCVVAATREADNWRVVVSSMPFDWQKNLPVLSNIVSYLADGRPSTVFLTQPSGASVSARLAQTGGRAVGLAFREFVLGRDDEQIIDEARNNTFDTIVVEQVVQLPGRLRDVLEHRSSAGQLEVVSLPAHNTDAILLKGQRFRMDPLVHEFVVQSSAMCGGGFIEGSFWATVDALRSIDKISPSLLHDRFPGLALDATAPHEQPDGSYDGVFAATAGFAWLQFKFGDRTLAKTIGWLQGRVDEASTRDRLYYWMILAEAKMLTAQEVANARDELGAIWGQMQRQADIVAAADCALVIDPGGETTAAYLELLAEALDRGAGQDIWLDLGLAGDVLRLAAPLACRGEGGSDKLMRCVECSLDSLLHWFYSDGVAAGVDANASMRVRGKAIAGLKSFSDVSPVPLWSLLELLDLSSRNAEQRLRREARSDLVDYLRGEYRTLSEVYGNSRRDLDEILEAQAKQSRRRLPLVIATLVVVYVLGTLAIAGIVKGGWTAVLRDAFVKAYPVHLGIAGVVAAIGTILLAHRQLIENRRGNRNETNVGADSAANHVPEHDNG